MGGRSAPRRLIPPPTENGREMSVAHSIPPRLGWVRKLRAFHDCERMGEGDLPAPRLAFKRLGGDLAKLVQPKATAFVAGAGLGLHDPFDQQVRLSCNLRGPRGARWHICAVAFGAVISALVSIEVDNMIHINDLADGGTDFRSTVLCRLCTHVPRRFCNRDETTPPPGSSSSPPPTPEG